MLYCANQRQGTDAIRTEPMIYIVAGQVVLHVSVGTRGGDSKTS